MFRSRSGLMRVLAPGGLLALVLLLAVCPAAPAQPGDKERDLDELRRLFKEPKSTADFWNRVQFEIDVGSYDLAARYLKAMVGKATDAELLDLYEKEGSIAFLKLRNVPMWSKDKKEQEEAAKNVETLIQRVTEAVRKKRADPVRIKGFIQALNATPEERDYAIRELHTSGAQAIPHLIDAIRGTTDPGERLTYLNALRRLGPETVPPMLAALSIPEEPLQLDLLDILRKNRSRQSREIVPHLWFLSASPTEPDAVRRAATDYLASVLDLPASRLPSAKTALTREAERYYRHEVNLGGTDAVPIWRWDGKTIVQGWPGKPLVTASQAEEYRGLYFARQALSLDPGYRPAQVVFLSLALDKAFPPPSKPGVVTPPPAISPDLKNLVSRASPELIVTVLERALDENRVPVILALVRNLGDRAEVIATRPAGRGHSPLTRALYVPDRRVQLAAAEATLQIPATTAPVPATRVVDILARTLAAAPGGAAKPKVVVAYFAEEFRDKIADLVNKAGYEAIKFGTGREVLQRMNKAADIDLILADVDLPDPGLASFLAQLRADRNNAHVPVLLTITPPAPPLVPGGKARMYKPGVEPLPVDREGRLLRFVERYPGVSLVSLGAVLDLLSLDALLKARIADPGSPTLTPAEQRDHAERAAKALANVAQGAPPGFDVRTAANSILDAVHAGRLGPEAQIATLIAAGRIPGSRAQVELSTVALDNARPILVRVAAASELVHHVQRFGIQMTGAQVEPLRELAAKPDLDANLKAQLSAFLGSLRPGDRVTGERLRGYTPPVAAPLPLPRPPPEK
jgi:CheY-like chemotaxis protein